MSAAAPVGEEQIDLIDVDMGVFSLSAVLNNAVVNGVQHHQQADGLEVFTQILNVVADDTVAGVDIGLMGKHVQAAGGEQDEGQTAAVHSR